MPAQLTAKTVGLLRTILEQMTPELQKKKFWSNSLFDFGIDKDAIDLMSIRDFQWGDILPALYKGRFGNNNSYFSNSLPEAVCKEILGQLLAFAVHNNASKPQTQSLIQLMKADGFEVSLPATAAPSIPKSETTKPLIPASGVIQDSVVSKTSAAKHEKPWTRDQKIGAVALVLALVAIAVAIATPEIRQKIGLEKPASISSKKAEPASPGSQSTNDIVWNFDKEGERFTFLGMQTVPGVVSEPLITGFQAHGKSNLDDPILHFSGFIRSDTTNETFPIFLARDNRFLQPEKMLGIPRRAEFDLHATFPSNHPERYSGEGMNASAFLRQYPEFTFVFEYDGKKYSKHFSKEVVWAAVENFRKKSLGYDKP